jgi:DNA recombination protein RmuC
MDMIAVIIGLCGGLITGSLAAYNFCQRKQRQLEKQLFSLEKEQLLNTERLQHSQQSHKELQQLHADLQDAKYGLQQNLSITQSENKHLQEKLLHQKEEIVQLQEQLKQQFENMASRILADNREQLAHSNQERLNLILDPLKERISAFEKKVDESYKSQSLEQGLLKSEIEKLMLLNQHMSEEARNLTLALKGDNKTQGNWGEMVLERILESSGLSKGQEYILQGEDMQLRTDEGQLQKPDVIIRLPEGKHLIIDAKVSLKAYEQFSCAATDQERASFLKQHISSLKGHVKGLSEKHYHTHKKLHTPDFVLLFLPIEASFSLALGNENNDLFSYAWERKVVIVSPTTLLATLRTAASIWKYEKQNRNALQIAEEGGKLYDKLYLFVSELEKVGKHLQQSQDSYSEAMKKLSSGKGNLLDRAEKLKAMGIATKKDMEQLQWIQAKSQADNS